MRWIWMVALSVLACTFACTPDMINHETKTEAPADSGPDQSEPDKDIKTDKVTPKSCKHDCDCLSSGMVCDGASGVCAALRRPSNCLSCEGGCQPGNPCVNNDSSIGTCKDTSTCQDDCDCINAGGVCESGSCNTVVARASSCMSCDAPNCKEGTRCFKPDKTIGVCSAAKSCKHDCDCYGDGLVCDATNGVCAALRRVSNCLACDGGLCKAGAPCYNKDKTIGTCTAKTCKNDCDCQAAGMNCDSGLCGLSNRVNTCPACDDSSCPQGAPCYNKDNTIGTCSSTQSCKDDCDCVKSGGICENGSCTNARPRPNSCPSCADPNCKEGTRCYEADKSVGTCGAATACKDDCDCIKAGGVCHNGSCDATIKRASLCPSCLSATCQPGTRCYNPDNTIGTCGSTYKCKEDCDCVPYGLLCDSGTCRALRRLSQCPSCSDPNCKAGTRCEGPNNTLGVCGGAAKCKDDCDCIKAGGVCESGSCNTVVTRASNCPSCLNSTCQAGTRCYNPDKTIGTCGGTKTCKEDCDCVPYGLLCDSGTCRALRRLSQCPSCTDPTCKAGTRCEGPNNTVGVCAGSGKTFACGGKQCQAGAEYCSMTVGGAAPSCQGLPPHSGTSCPSYCNSLTGCMDGKLRCNCPSTSCVAMKQSCTDCQCLKTTGQVPPSGPCQCQDKNGNPHVTCYAP